MGQDQVKSQFLSSIISKYGNLNLLARVLSDLSFASILHTYYYTADSASENLSKLKRIHGMVPYKTLWGILKISNPLMVVKGVLDLFLLQPMGARSLLQR